MRLQTKCPKCKALRMNLTDEEFDAILVAGIATCEICGHVRRFPQKLKRALPPKTANKTAKLPRLESASREEMRLTQ